MRGCSIRCFTAQGGRQTDLNVDPRYPFELQSRFLSDIPAVRRAAWCGPLHGACYGVGTLSSVLAAAIRFYGCWLRQPTGSAPRPPWVWCKGLRVVVVRQRGCGPGDGGSTTVASKPAGGSGASLRASVDYMLDVLPWMEVLTTALKGTGDCAEVTWRFLGLSIPGWTAIFFSLLVIVGLVMLLRPPRKPEWIQG